MARDIAAEVAERIDAEHLDDAAAFAARQLADVGVARIRLAPGDMTEYRILIAAAGDEWAYGDVRSGRYLWVCLCADFGAGYEWHGGKVDGYYAAAKWVNAGVNKSTRAWTGEVVARFLTAVAQARSERSRSDQA